MPSKNEFDDILKNKFENFEAPLPKGGFAAIKDRVPTKRRRGFLLPFFAAASIFFATLSGYLFLKQFDKANTNQSLSSQKEDIKPANSSTNKLDNKQQTKVIALNSKNATTNESRTTLVNSSNENLNSNSGSPSNSTFANTNQNLIASLTANTNQDLVNNTVILDDNNETNYINSINNGLSPALLRHIVLAETDGAKRTLTGAIAINLLENPASDEEEDKKEDKESKYHYGLSIAPVYLSKRLASNESDNVYIKDFDKVNQFTTSKSGLNVGFILSRVLGKRLEIFSKVDMTNLRDENTFNVLEKLDAPQLVSTDGNSMTLSSYKTSQVENKSSYIYSGLNAGVRYKIGSSSFVSLGSGAHYLLTSKDSNPIVNAENNKLNFSSSFSIGKSYKLGDKLSLAVEPELKLYYKSFQQNGVYQSKPFTTGLNFVLTY